MKTVLAHGVFDLLHSGHIAHLMQARSFGDHLIVSVLADKHVTKNRKCIDDQLDRMFKVGALRCVDEVLLCNEPGPGYLIRTLLPYIYVRSDEYLYRNQPEYFDCRNLGVRLGFTKTVPPHTTSLIERIKRA